MNINIVNHCKNKGRWQSPVLCDERSVCRNTSAVGSKNFEFVCEWFCQEPSVRRSMIKAKSVSIWCAWRLRTFIVMKRLCHFKRRRGIGIYKMFIGWAVFRTSP